MLDTRHNAGVRGGEDQVRSPPLPCCLQRCAAAGAPSPQSVTPCYTLCCRALPQACYRLYFGRQVACYNHAVVERYKLTVRPYIGPTSMDAEMAFIVRCPTAYKALPYSI